MGRRWRASAPQSYRITVGTGVMSQPLRIAILSRCRLRSRSALPSWPSAFFVSIAKSAGQTRSAPAMPMVALVTALLARAPTQAAPAEIVSRSCSRRRGFWEWLAPQAPAGAGEGDRGAPPRQPSGLACCPTPSASLLVIESRCSAGAATSPAQRSCCAWSSCEHASPGSALCWRGHGGATAGG